MSHVYWSMAITIFGMRIRTNKEMSSMSTPMMPISKRINLTQIIKIVSFTINPISATCQKSIKTSSEIWLSTC